MIEDLGQDGTGRRQERRLPGCLTGCLGAVALLILALIGSVLYWRSADAPPAALQLTEPQLVGTWASADGGTLVLRSDGTFSATRVCGFGAADPPVGSDSGTWERGGSTYNPYAPAPATAAVFLTGATGRNELDEGGAGDAAVLWQYVGPPDDSSTYCELHKR